MFFVFLTLMPNFMSIGCYYYSIHKLIFLCKILNYKNLKFKHFIDDIVIDLRFSRNFVNTEDIRRKCNLMISLSKFTSNKNILTMSLYFPLPCHKTSLGGLQIAKYIHG